MANNTENYDDLITHFKNIGINVNETSLRNKLDLSNVHVQSTVSTILSELVSGQPKGQLKVGEKVLAIFGKDFQYFPGVLTRTSAIDCDVKWDDNTGIETKSVTNVVLHVTPTVESLTEGARVFFKQGWYTEGGLNAARWHEGFIKNITNLDGKTLFDGVHSRSEQDGKWIGYRGYSKVFIGKTVDELRLCSAPANDDDLPPTESAPAYTSFAEVSMEPNSTTPVPGSHVLCFYGQWTFYPATIVKFDKSKLQFKVDWDDGDTANQKKRPYDYVALDKVPASMDLGVGTAVLHPPPKLVPNLFFLNLFSTSHHHMFTTS